MMHNNERLYSVIKAIHMSEKAIKGEEKVNQYVFKVDVDANKFLIKKAVEKVFDVAVEAVRVVNVKGKRKMFKQRIGKRQSWKKAYVKLKEGQEISYSGISDKG